MRIYYILFNQDIVSVFTMMNRCMCDLNFLDTHKDASALIYGTRV
jgi:hypothetical protein